MRNVVAIGFLVFGVCSCNPSEMNMSSGHSEGIGLGAKFEGQAEAKLNPQPRQGYGLVFEIENTPGPFAMVEAGAQYDVVNSDECGYLNDAAGVIPRISRNEGIPLVRDASGAYRGTVYVDRMMDEEYFGRGVCHWEPVIVYLVMRATGKDGETRFQPVMEASKVIKGGVVEKYFLKQKYPRSEMDNFADYGTSSPRRMQPEIRGRLFKVTIRSEGRAS